MDRSLESFVERVKHIADTNSTSKNEEVMQDADAPTILDLQEFDQMRQEVTNSYAFLQRLQLIKLLSQMEAFDEKREIVIKKCRDLQKLCKVGQHSCLSCLLTTFLYSNSGMLEFYL